MRRFMLLVLAILLPLQLAWGAVTSYCQHESGAAARHFGHHEHVHKADGKKAADSRVGQDTDCGTCHATGAPVLIDLPPVQVVLAPASHPAPRPSPALPSHPAAAPERPQWHRLA